jgi:hypothetical protein
VYLLIRQGKRAKHRDDEILSLVMGSLVQGYYYSVLGDHYLQQNWIVLKAILDQNESTAAKRPAVPVRGAKMAAKKKQMAKKAAARKGEKANEKAAAAQKKAVQKETIGKAAAIKAAARNAAVRNVEDAAKKTEVTAPSAQAANKAPTATMPPAPQKRYQQPMPARPPMGQRAENTGGGSVSDRLRVLSGRSYDLYQERFLTHARPAIRKILGAGKGIFFNLPEKAEDLVYNFLRDHYADPYMNWGDSKERAELIGMGFKLESLNPVIDEGFKAVRD